jgi:undecaprenyl-diphosphatase
LEEVDPMPNLLDRLGRREWPLLAAFALFAAAVWVFLELADEVVEGGTAAFDQAILMALRSEADPADPLGPAWLEELMRDFTALGGVGVLTLVVLSAIGYLLVLRKPRAALAVMLTVGGGIALSTAMKLGFDRPRPALVGHGYHAATASFPSGHSMMAAVV